MQLFRVFVREADEILLQLAYVRILHQGMALRQILLSCAVLSRHRHFPHESSITADHFVGKRGDSVRLRVIVEMVRAFFDDADIENRLAALATSRL
jgi:hypothetical protein